jgi:DNA modification methylase
MKPWLDDGDVQLYHGDVREVLDQLPAESVRTVVTSPPYWGLRDYGYEGQIGMEPTFEEFLASIVDVFDRVRRVLTDDGTIWVNMGDSYAGAPNGATGKRTTGAGTWRADKPMDTSKGSSCKPKDLMGQPWEVAFALRAAGWYLRRDVIWAKPNPMPESITDRPVTAHEYVFLLSKSPRYYYDDEAARTPLAPETMRAWNKVQAPRPAGSGEERFRRGNAWGRDLPQRRVSVDEDGNPMGARFRSVWSIPVVAFPGAHFATFPPALVDPCVVATSEPGDIVLDPFVGSGTTAEVARKHGRRAIGIDGSAEYLELAAGRLAQQSLLAGGAA